MTACETGWAGAMCPAPATVRVTITSGGSPWDERAMCTAHGEIVVRRRPPDSDTVTIEALDTGRRLRYVFGGPT